MAKQRSQARGRRSTIDKRRIDAYGKKIDRAFVAAALSAADPRGGRMPTLAGVEPKGKGSLRLKGLSRDATAALRAAGYRDAAALSTFKVVDLAAGDPSGVTLRDLDRLHEERLAVSYTDVGMTAEVARALAVHRIEWYLVPWFLPHCDGTPVPELPGLHRPEIVDALIDPAVLERLKDLHRRPEPLPIGPDDPPWWVPGGGFTDPPGELDLLDVGHLVRTDLDEVTIDRFLTEGVGSEEIGVAVHTAQRLFAEGRAVEARGVLQQVQATDGDKAGPVAQYQAAVLAPALVALHDADRERHPERHIQVLRQAVTGAIPGSATHVALLRDATASTRSAGDAHMRRARAAQGPERQAWRHAAKRAYLEALTGGQTDVGAGDATIPLLTAAPLLDLYRTAGAAISSPDAPGVVRNPSDKAVDGRIVPAHATAYMLNAGGVSSLSDPIVVAHAHRAWRQLHTLTCDAGPYIPRVLPGDRFRFDWLLDEARTLAADAARIEELLTSFLNLVMSQTLDKIGAVSGVLDELARLVDDLVKRVEAVAAEIPAIVRDLASKAQTAAVIVALVRWLREWPHDRWIRVIETIIDAVRRGDNVIDRVVAAILSPLESALDDVLRDARTRIEQLLGRLQGEIPETALPGELIDAFREALSAAGVSDPTDDIIKPLQDALDGLDLMAIAREALDDLASVATVPPWLKAILVTWVLAPMVGAVLALLMSGPIGWVLLLVGLDYLVSLAVRALTDVLGLARDLNNQVDEALARLNELIGGLVAALSNIGALQGMLTGVSALLDAIEAALPEEVRDAVHGALTTARDTVLDNVHGLTVALERSFFRETLELVQAAPEEGFATELPRDGQMLGFNDPRYGSSALVASVLSAYELERVRRTTQALQELTQVISLRHLLGSAAALQPLLQGLPLSFAITQTFLDRLTPGLEQVLIKDVQVQLDFDVPAETQQALDVVLSLASVLGGGAADPALDGRVPGGGFPGLPVVAGRVPTGIPAVLTHQGTSYVRLRPDPELSNAYTDRCGCPANPLKLSPPIRGTRLLDDTDPEAHAAGWRRLQLLDAPAHQVLSHFDVLADQVRFVSADKELKPFEHRGLVGGFTLDVPALRLASVEHQLPALRDIRLVVSTVARYSSHLGDLVAQEPVPVPEPDPVAEAAGLVPSLGLPLDTTAILDKLDDVKDAIDGVAGGIAAALGGTLDDLTVAVDTTISGFAEVTDRMATNVAAALGNLLATVDGLAGDIAILQLTSPSGAISGATALAWDSTDITAGLADQGIDASSVSRVVQVVVVPVVGGSLLGGTVTWPGSTGQLQHTPAGGSPQSAPVTFDGGTILVAARDLGSPTAPQGDWGLSLPAGLPPLDRVLLGLVLETAG